ncbi:MAG: penicillin acylase family protein, partial [Ilumatobacteraceae bacterium]
MSAGVSRSSRGSNAAAGFLCAAGLLIAACSGGGDDGAAAESTVAPPSTDAPSTTQAVDTSAPTTAPPPAITTDRAYYVLNPGNYGGLPVTDDSLDQLPLYDGLTPLRDDVTEADLDRFYLPENFEPVGATTEEPTGRPGTTIEYDEYGVAHVTGETREDLAFGAGWVTGRDRDLLIDLGRGPARAAVADVPGLDAFQLVLSGQQFVPSAATEQLVTDQVQAIRDAYGDEGEQILADAAAYADGLNAYWASAGLDREPATVNDVIATTAFIGSIFGAGGGAEAYNAEFLSILQARLGDAEGRSVWDDVMRTDDPEAPTSIEDRFDYGVMTGGEVTGSVMIDEGSIVATDPAAPSGDAPAEPAAQGIRRVDAADSPPGIKASNWLIVSPEQSVNDTTMAVMGPQLGYYYPEIVMQIHLSGPGIEAQGAAVPGLAMYLL